MARGTQHRKRSPRANAGAQAAVARPHKGKPKPPQWQEELFFQRLRNHAKWIYVGLAITFVLGFVLLGVGSGSTGIGDALQNAFNFGSNGGTSISSLEHKVADHPNNAADWRALATAYESKQRTSDAVTALERYTALRPKDTDALGELATQYTALANVYNTDYANAQTAAALAAPAPFTPPSSSPLGRAFNNPSALQDPISTAVQSAQTSALSAAATKLQATATKAEAAYQKLAALTPDDATLQIQLGQAAQTAGDSATAVAAYRRFLKLAPTDPLAPQVKKVIKSLAAQAAAQSTTQPSG
ncbi:MAG TPA: tetratricopeptide repeat protein [Gaiellaceae bacterium]